ncbi:MAG: hypothetical protein LBQ71_03100 [Hungatella sp.]|jgi:hypothetical protein|nr:hypothetical protein [Hungatella sp.]
MERLDIDLYLACMEKEDKTESNEEKLKQKAMEKIEKLHQEIRKVKELNMERTVFFENLFSICLPKNLLLNEIREEGVILLRSQSEHLALVIKVLDCNKPIDLEYIKKNYQEQMAMSKQQTWFDIDGNEMVDGVEIFYFTAIHSMPDQNQVNYIILFCLDNKTVILDFNMREESYTFWKNSIAVMMKTIQKAGGDFDDK